MDPWEFLGRSWETITSIVAGAVLGAGISWGFSKRASAELRTEAVRLRRLIGDLERLRTLDSSSELRRDDEGVPTGGIAYNLGAMAGMGLQMTAELTVTPAWKPDGAAFREAMREIEVREEEHRIYLAWYNADWSRIYWP